MEMEIFEKTIIIILCIGTLCLPPVYLFICGIGIIALAFSLLLIELFLLILILGITVPPLLVLVCSMKTALFLIGDRFGTTWLHKLDKWGENIEVKNKYKPFSWLELDEHRNNH